MAAVNGAGSSTARHYEGCSSIADYDVIDKLGEGTFGYVESGQPWISSHLARRARTSVDAPGIVEWSTKLVVAGLSDLLPSSKF